MKIFFVDLSREEIAAAKRYPAHTALCIRGGWDLCRPDQAIGECSDNVLVLVAVVFILFCLTFVHICQSLSHYILIEVVYIYGSFIYYKHTGGNEECILSGCNRMMDLGF